MTLDVLTGALAIFTLLLVAATVYMGKEMRATRRLSIQPQLVLDLTMISKMVAAIALTNIGAGAAVDVDLEIIFTASADGEDVKRGWRTRLILPGERHVFMPPLNADGHVPAFADFAQAYRAIRVVGSFRNRFGAEHELDEAVADVPTAQRLGADAMHVFEDRAADRAAERLSDPLKTIAQSLEVLVGVGHSKDTVQRVSMLTRSRSAARHFVGLPNVTTDGFVADQWWGPEGHQRRERQQRVAKWWIGRLVQRWLA